MAGNVILQWNCLSLHSRSLELGLLMSTHDPAVICLQETRLRPNTNMNFKNYIEIYKSNNDLTNGWYAYKIYFENQLSFVKSTKANLLSYCG